MKIYIIGSVASSKTALSKNLSNQLNIPHYEPDCIVHAKTESGSYKRTYLEQVEEILRIDNGGDWIIEGTYRSTCHCLLDMADKIIFLDTPLYLRKLRIFKRFIKQQLHIEPCHYKSDVKMLKLMYKWTRDFEKDREQFEKMLSCYKNKLFKIESTKLNNIINNLSINKGYGD